MILSRRSHGRVPVPVGQGHGGAGFRKCFGGGQAEPGRGAGNQGDPAAEIICSIHAQFPLLVSVRRFLPNTGKALACP